ncbi:MAG: DUF1259 domain-containing protein [Pyrinomonadaceae bacterium]
MLSACTATEQKQNTNAQQQAASVDWKLVDRAMERNGALLPGDAYRFNIPRSDLHVTVKGVEIKPALALGSWAAFKMMNAGTAMVMGDMVLTEDEVAPVMSKLQEGGVEQSALHHHVLGESPRVLYMHLSGHGDPVKMAGTIRAALALTKTPVAAANQTSNAGNAAESGNPASAPATAPPESLSIDTKEIEQIIGRSGKVNGGVFQLSVPRAVKITEDGMDIPPSMGTATALNFQPTGEGRAAITGDFVLIASEVNPVIRALIENGIDVTSLHNHMLNDEPRIFFMHFWANDDALKLARGLRAAIDKTNSAPATNK